MDIFATNQPFHFGEACYDKGGRYGPVKQPHLDLAYLFSGTAIVNADSETSTVHAGMVIFTYTEQMLEVIYPADEDQTVVWCHTGQVVAPIEYRSQLKAVPKALPPSNLILTLFKEGVSLASSGSASASRVRDTLGAAIFNEYFRLAHLEEEESKLPTPVLRTKRYLDEHFTEECDLKRISKIARLSPNYLLQLFKQYIGTTPTSYMWELRTRKGVQFLLRTGLPVSTIAYECGFKTQHHFARIIKKVYGSTPSGLREQHWMRDPAEFNKDIPDLKFK